MSNIINTPNTTVTSSSAIVCNSCSVQTSSGYSCCSLWLCPSCYTNHVTQPSTVPYHYNPGTYTSLPTITVPSEAYVKGFFDNLLQLKQLWNEMGCCSNCKKSTSLVLEYKVIEITRKLCRVCLLKQADKFFGVNSNPELESVLFE